MTTTTNMTSNNYDGCAGNSTGSDELTIGLFKKADTLTFTKEEWEAFKAFGDELMACLG